MDRNKELRKVPEGYLDMIAVTLDINEDWKRVMALIPKDLQSRYFIPKYNCEHVRLIEQHARATNTKCATILFDEWGTSGRVRPTVQTLMDILLKSQMIRAAEELASMLNEQLPPRPKDGVGANIDLDISALLNNSSGLQSGQVNGNGSFGNGTFGSLHDKPTKPMTTRNIQHDVVGIGHLPTAQMQSNIVNVNTNADSQYLIPAFSELNPITVEFNDSASGTETSISTHNSDSSVSASEDIISHSINEDQSMFMIPPSHLLLQMDSEVLDDPNLINFKYSELESLTGNFSGSHIGSGGFGDVFVGIHDRFGKVAVKRAHRMLINTPSVNFVKIFNTEVRSLTILRHENIVPILGYSLDASPCIVCEYIEGGSLQENIASKILNEKQRIDIIVGTAKGLKYIHNTVKPPSVTDSEDVINSSQKKAYFLHGDVKSANILITKDFVPKLCDFGLSREYMTTIHHTQSIMGTPAYMPPEKFSGTITQKGDVFSFGIVILELITGLQPIVHDSNGDTNIKEFVEENCVNNNIANLVDPVVGTWPKAQNIYELAQQCMTNNKNKRPSMNEVCESLNEIIISDNN